MCRLLSLFPCQLSYPVIFPRQFTLYIIFRKHLLSCSTHFCRIVSFRDNCIGLFQFFSLSMKIFMFKFSFSAFDLLTNGSLRIFDIPLASRKLGSVSILQKIFLSLVQVYNFHVLYKDIYGVFKHILSQNNPCQRKIIWFLYHQTGELYCFLYFQLLLLVKKHYYIARPWHIFVLVFIVNIAYYTKDALYWPEYWAISAFIYISTVMNSMDIWLAHAVISEPKIAMGISDGIRDKVVNGFTAYYLTKYPVLHN